MEEEWMRDRALLRDLLEKTPHASPQELAQEIGRGVELGQEVAQAPGEIRDLHDLSVLCSYSRAHHAPYFRWDVLVTQKIVEMRFAAPENLKRVPGPRALLYYLPRDESVASRTRTTTPLQPNERARSCMLQAAWSLIPKSRPSQRASQAIGRDRGWMRKDVGTVSPEQSSASANASMWSKFAMRVDAGTSIALSAQAREDFHLPDGVGSGDRLLAKVRMPAADDL
jgi:hypothetical protein